MAQNNNKRLRINSRERKGNLQASKKSSQGNRRETRKVGDVVAKETKHLKEGGCSGSNVQRMSDFDDLGRNSMETKGKWWVG